MPAGFATIRRTPPRRQVNASRIGDDDLLASTLSTMQAMIGERSNTPIGGIIRRKMLR